MRRASSTCWKRSFKKGDYVFIAGYLRHDGLPKIGVDDAVQNLARADVISRHHKIMAFTHILSRGFGRHRRIECRDGLTRLYLSTKIKVVRLLWRLRRKKEDEAVDLQTEQATPRNESTLGQGGIVAAVHDSLWFGYGLQWEGGT